jgi:hypothetical protein
MAPANTEILLYNPDNPSQPLRLPSMVDVSWLKDTLEFSPDKGTAPGQLAAATTTKAPSIADGADAAPSKKRTRSLSDEHPATVKTARIEALHPPPTPVGTSTLTLAFEDDSDEDDD